MSTAAAGAGLSRVVWRLRLAAVCLGLTLLALSQDAGGVIADTKLDLVVDPGRLLGRGLHLWDPLAAFGSLQNQAYGYLFPMGPFFLLGHDVGLPAWVVQRLWHAALLVAAFLGATRLAGRLGTGPPWARVVTGLAYALAPRVLTELGGISSELMPLAAAPWVLLPLIAPRDPRTAAARSGVALLFAGGVNAAATLAILPLPVWWLLTREPGAVRRRLAGWWAVAVVAACAWWAVPLLLLGRYSPPFLDWIEAATTTTSVTTLFDTLRGTDHWLGWLSGPAGPEWPAGHALAVTRVGVLATAGLALLGLLGLVRPGLPHRKFLVGGVLIGVAAVTFGHVGPLAAPGAGTLRDVLDGPLAPFRNVHKFDPVLRLPLALGVGWFLGTVRLPRQVPYGRVFVPAVAVALLAVTAGPGLAGRLTPARNDTVAAYWPEAAAWLARQPGHGRALLVPGATTGAYLWGRTGDDVMQPLARSPWAVRDSVPLGSAGATRLLDAVDARLDAGRGGRGLAPVLVRSGVDYVVVRNDLDQTRASSTSPDLVHEALADSGLTRAAAFGPMLRQLSGTAYPAVEVFYVGGAGPVGRLSADDPLRTTGGPEDVLALADRGLLGSRALLLPGDDPGRPATPVVSDSYRKREVRFAAVRDVAGPALAADEPYAGRRRAYDYVPAGIGPPAEVRYGGGLTGVSASSSGSDADAVLARGNWHQPYSAVDGDDDTSWVSGSFTGAVGQWLELRFAGPLSVAGLTVAFTGEQFVGPLPSRLTVVTDRGSVTSEVSPDPLEQAVATPPGTTRTLRLQVAAVAGGGRGFAAGIATVRVPLLFPERTLALPGAPSSAAAPLVLLQATPGNHPACVTTPDGAACTPIAQRPGEEDGGIDRTFSTDGTDDFDLAVTVRPRSGTALDRLLAPATGLRATASSRLVTDPRGQAAAAVDGDAGTGWLAAPGDPRPTLRLRWDGARVVQGLRLAPFVATSSTLPRAVTVTTGGRTVRAAVDRDGYVRMAPVRTDRLTVVVTRAAGDDGEPVGISEVTVLSPDGVLRGRPAATVALPCGSGPDVELDGTRYRTSVRATRADWTGAAVLAASPCTGAAPGRVRLGPGEHRLRLAATATTRPDTVTLAPAAGRSGLGLDAGTASATAWGDTERTAQVPAQPAATYLVVHENANAGWHAELAGRPLTAVRIDGWQQGYLVPAGVGGDVRLSYRPDGPYRLGLLAGALLALVVLVLAIGRTTPEPELAERRGGRVGWLVLAAAAVLAAPVLLAVAVAGAAVTRLLGRPATAAGTALVAAGLGTAVLVAAVRPATDGPFGQTGLAQLCCAVALAGLLVPLLDRLSVRRRPSDSSGRSSSR
ncbi:MAG TPA: alpha-(1-_3)-arabinofuranosyltransferase family protein [Mycobacteriales bacterium]